MPNVPPRSQRRVGVSALVLATALAAGVSCSSESPRKTRVQTREVWVSFQGKPADLTPANRNEIASRVLSEQCRDETVREVELIVKFYSDDGDFVYRSGEAPLPWLLTKTTHTEPKAFVCGRPLPASLTNA